MSPLFFLNFFFTLLILDFIINFIVYFEILVLDLFLAKSTDLVHHLSIFEISLLQHMTFTLLILRFSNFK